MGTSSKDIMAAIRAPALAAPVVLHRPEHPVYRSEAIAFQGVPTIEATTRGRLWASWYGGGVGEGPENFILLVRSDDAGETWSEVQLVIDPPGAVRAFDPLLWRDPSGWLWLFWAQAHTLHDGAWGVWAMHTNDPDGEHPIWSEPRRLADGILLNKPLVTRRGEWLFPISRPRSYVLRIELKSLPEHQQVGFLHLARPEELAALNEASGGWVYCSRDGGQTLECLGRARVDDAFASHYEHMLAENPDGTLWMFLRALYGMGRSESHDGGHSWSPVERTSWAHPASRFFLGRLASGRLLMVKHGDLSGRVPEETGPLRHELTAFLSDDHGASWRGGLLLDERLCSYPDAAQTPDGSICVIYDRGRTEEKEILLARFTEDDVLTGELRSPHTATRIPINKATGTPP